MVFLNIEILTSGEATPFSAKLGAAMPLVMAIGILLATLFATASVRGTILVCLGGGWLALTVAQGQDALASLGAMGSQGPMGGFSSVMGQMLLVMLLLVLGLKGLFAGTLIRRYRPMNSSAGLIAAGGGVLFLVSLLIPMLPVGPDEKTVLIAVPFKLMGVGDGHAVAMGLLLLLAMACWGLSSILCLGNISSGQESSNTSASILFRLGAVSLFCVMVYPLVMMSTKSATAQLLPMMLVNYLKILTGVVGMFLLLPTGLADLLIATDRS